MSIGGGGDFAAWADLGEATADECPAGFVDDDKPLPSGVTALFAAERVWLSMPYAHDSFVPPLMPIDVVCLQVEMLAAAHFYTPWRAIDGMPFDLLPDEEIRRACLGLVVGARMRYAIHAGLMPPEPLPNESDYPIYTRQQYDEWRRAVRDPAVRGEDSSERGESIRFLASFAFQQAWNPNIELSRRRIEKAIVDNEGGNERRARNRRRISPRVIDGFAELIHQLGARQLWCVERGQVVAQLRTAHNTLNAAFEPGVQFDGEVRQLPDDTSGIATPDEVDVTLLAMLREQRERLDPSRHRSLADALADALHGSWGPDMTIVVEQLIEVARRIDEFSTPVQAAIVYEFFHGAVKQADVAREYGITRDQFRSAQAEGCLLLRRIVTA
jgi:hypothetical protein